MEDQTAPATSGTVQALQTLPGPSPSPSGTPEPPTSTPTVTPTSTATQTPAPPSVSVSANTNCRTGPAQVYHFRGALLVGQSAEVVALSTVPNYWYIRNPDRPGEFCWLWGEYATVEGNTDNLPVFTPEPSPIPTIDFDLFLHSFQSCGSDTLVVFTVQNSGQGMLQTGRITIVDRTDGSILYGPVLDRHPFADAPASCPPGHGNQLFPGAAAYIVAPLGSTPSGHSADATITLCTMDYLGGDCITKDIFFNFP